MANCTDDKWLTNGPWNIQTVCLTIQTDVTILQTDVTILQTDVTILQTDVTILQTDANVFQALYANCSNGLSNTLNGFF